MPQPPAGYQTRRSSSIIIMNIAVVDDDPSFSKAIGEALTAVGHHVSIFSSAEQFLENVPSEWPNCFVVDQQMPGRTGLEFIEEIRQSHALAKAIIVSASRSQQLRESAAEMSIPLLHKPVTGADLMGMITRVFEN